MFSNLSIIAYNIAYVHVSICIISEICFDTSILILKSSSYLIGKLEFFCSETIPRKVQTCQSEVEELVRTAILNQADADHKAAVLERAESGLLDGRCRANSAAGIGRAGDRDYRWSVR